MTFAIWSLVQVAVVFGLYRYRRRRDRRHVPRALRWLEPVKRLELPAGRSMQWCDCKRTWEAAPELFRIDVLGRADPQYVCSHCSRRVRDSVLLLEAQTRKFFRDNAPWSRPVPMPDPPGPIAMPIAGPGVPSKR